MKNNLLILFAIAFSTTTFAQFGQIENGGFENWHNETIYENPTAWKTSNDLEYLGTSILTKSTDANDGNYSARFDVEIVNSDTLSSYVLLGDISGGNGPDGGITYTDNFEAFTIDYKGSLEVGDTLQLLMIRYLNGSTVDYQVKPVFYGNQPTWTTSVIFVGNQPQDSLFIGFILGDADGDSAPHPNSWALLDNIKLLSGGVQQSNLPNHSFENWSDITLENPNSWFTINDLITASANDNVTKTTDANSGQFAVQLETILIDNDTIEAYLSIGEIDIYNATFAQIPYNVTPTNVSGSYKYTSVNGSTGKLNIIFYQSGSPIGFHVETFSSQNNYTNFSAPLTIVGTPDSILILANSGPEVGSILLLDDLSFSGGNVSLDEILSIDYQMYPNPTKEIVSIRLPEDGAYAISIVDLNGKELSLLQNQNGIATLNVGNLESGVYFVTVFNDVTKETKRLIVE